MISQRNFAFYATIPVNLVLIVWVWIGRAFFGAGGWWILIFLVTVVPVLAVALTATTILAFTQHQPATTGRLTVSQFWCLIGVWVSMFFFGFFVVDFGDTKESERSAFTLFTGRAGLDVSNALSMIFFFVTIISYFGLLVLLITGQQGRRERKLQQDYAAGSEVSPAWPTQQTWPPGQPGEPAEHPGYGYGQEDQWAGPEASGTGDPSAEPPAGPADPWPGRR